MGLTISRISPGVLPCSLNNLRTIRGRHFEFGSSGSFSRRYVEMIFSISSGEGVGGLLLSVVGSRVDVSDGLGKGESKGDSRVENGGSSLVSEGEEEEEESSEEGEKGEGEEEEGVGSSISSGRLA
jgi:hypothetical protein